MSPRLSTVALVLVTELANGLLVRDKALEPYSFATAEALHP
jgi:hypothetical protein